MGTRLNWGRATPGQQAPPQHRGRRGCARGSPGAYYSNKALTDGGPGGH
jgi:hypothetical protein